MRSDLYGHHPRRQSFVNRNSSSLILVSKRAGNRSNSITQLVCPNLDVRKGPVDILLRLVRRKRLRRDIRADIPSAVLCGKFPKYLRFATRLTPLTFFKCKKSVVKKVTQEHRSARLFRDGVIVIAHSLPFDNYCFKGDWSFCRSDVFSVARRVCWEVQVTEVLHLCIPREVSRDRKRVYRFSLVECYGSFLENKHIYIYLHVYICLYMFIFKDVYKYKIY